MTVQSACTAVSDHTLLGDPKTRSCGHPETGKGHFPVFSGPLGTVLQRKSQRLISSRQKKFRMTFQFRISVPESDTFRGR